jgi:hypothetical protein
MKNQPQAGFFMAFTLATHAITPKRPFAGQRLNPQTR